MNRAKVIVSSDRAATGVYQDRSGPAVVAWLQEHGFECGPATVVPDDFQQLADQVLEGCDEGVDLVIVCGGTGLGPRDISPQVLRKLSDYEIAGFGELMRAESVKYSLNAYLSRCGAYAKGRSLLLAVAGNQKAAVEHLSIVSDLLDSALDALNGRCKHRRRHPDHDQQTVVTD